MKKVILQILILVLFLEVFIFNYQSFRVLSSNNEKFFSPTEFSEYKTIENYTYVQIDNISEEVKTVHINLKNEENVDYQFFYTDETSSEFRETASKQYVQKLEQSKYISTYLSGKSKKIAIKVYSPDAEIDSITINEKIPFRFNFGRVLILFIILSFM